jgi:hypothetical protein
VRSDPPNVFHQKIWLLKDLEIYPLQDIKGPCAPLTKCDAVSVVDVATSVWTCFDKLTADLKLPRGSVDIRYFAQDRNLSEVVFP